MMNHVLLLKCWVYSWMVEICWNGLRWKITGWWWLMKVSRRIVQRMKDENVHCIFCTSADAWLPAIASPKSPNHVETPSHMIPVMVGLWHWLYQRRCTAVEVCRCFDETPWRSRGHWHCPLETWDAPWPEGMILQWYLQVSGLAWGLQMFYQNWDGVLWERWERGGFVRRFTNKLHTKI